MPGGECLPRVKQYTPGGMTFNPLPAALFPDGSTRAGPGAGEQPEKVRRAPSR
jgi:hypothetical protein